MIKTKVPYIAGVSLNKCAKGVASKLFRSENSETVQMILPTYELFQLGEPALMNNWTR